MAQNSRAKRSEKELLTLTLASGVTIPDSKMAREVTELARDPENSLLFNHSSRVYYFSAATGKRKGLTFDPELLYVSAMFHDMGLTPKHSSATRVAAIISIVVDGEIAALDQNGRSSFQLLQSYGMRKQIP